MVYPSPPPSQHSIFTPVHGRNAHLFQPPKSQASVATTPTYASKSSDYFSNGASKKRSRPDSSYHEQHVHENKWDAAPPSWIASTPHDDDVFSSGQESYLVNEQYRLAGGYDTPGLVVNTDLDQIIDQDMEARRLTRDREATFGSLGNPLQGPLVRERNGIPRLPNVIDTHNENKVSWTRLAFSLVGKAFNFGTSVFKGFYAGGGQSYEFNEKHDHAGIVYRHGSPPTPIPGQWQGDDFFGDFEQDNPSSPPSASLRPPNKRRQTEKDEWVLIGTPDARGPSPKRKVSGNQVPQATKPAATRPSASRASSRRSLLPTAIRRQPSHVSQVGSPAAFTAGPDRRASVAHVRTPTSRPHSSAGHRSSLSASSEIMSPEAERYRKRQAKQDRVADKAIGNMSRQLEELIRQGQAALGTKISVEGDVDEEMDDVYAGGSRW